jgi:hypothetical protein
MSEHSTPQRFSTSTASPLSSSLSFADLCVWNRPALSRCERRNLSYGEKAEAICQLIDAGLEWMQGAKMIDGQGRLELTIRILFAIAMTAIVGAFFAIEFVTRGW